MALIPTDVGVNLRTQVDAPLRPTAPVSEISSDLPELRQGQVFSARIVEVLPEASYKALVAGKSITLSLSGGAKAGDTLDLVVVDKTARMVTARLAQPDLAGEGSESVYPHATFSPTAQLIGRLLPAQGETPRSVLLNQGAPLLPAKALTDDNMANQLAPQLEKAVTQSGIFYEAHQARWVAGDFQAQDLLEEPQNQRSHSPVTPSGQGQAHAAIHARSSEQALLTRGESSSPSAPTQQPPTTNGSIIPDDLRHLVQQQLDAAATQRMLWHGEVWPRQTMEWEIKKELPNRQGNEEQEENSWTSRLGLTMPNLGRVDATLELRNNGIHINLKTADGSSMTELQQRLPQLANALEAAGVPPLSLRVWQTEPHE